MGFQRSSFSRMPLRAVLIGMGLVARTKRDRALRREKREVVILFANAITSSASGDEFGGQMCAVSAK